MAINKNFPNYEKTKLPLKRVLVSRYGVDVSPKEGKNRHDRRAHFHVKKTSKVRNLQRSYLKGLLKKLSTGNVA